MIGFRRDRREQAVWKLSAAQNL